MDYINDEDAEEVEMTGEAEQPDDEKKRHGSGLIRVSNRAKKLA